MLIQIPCRRPSKRFEFDGIFNDIAQFKWCASNMLLCVVASLLTCSASVESARSADAVYSSVTSDEHMKEWLLLGPIPAQETAGDECGECAEAGPREGPPRSG
jgi:hypothetical protein